MSIISVKNYFQARKSDVFSLKKTALFFLKKTALFFIAPLQNEVVVSIYLNQSIYLPTIIVKWKGQTLTISNKDYCKIFTCI